ncbi:hypothetical protein OYC64_015201 [Pagothenia borchgrevinki]|uniref:DUF4371 domain-containing protein n=1 Tax=Pagothenia borchgrevinki TaxID=8213 RepID=A0ABD2H3D2_PAGBO
MDVSGIEQLSICIRYIKHVNGAKICEEFLGFCPLAKQDAASITEAILSQLEKWGLEIDYLRGQGYDGASAMSGHVSGVQQRMKELQPRALFTHCRSHALNLVVHGCSDIPFIRNTMATIENIAVFFSASAVRKHMLQEEPKGSKETQKESVKRKTGGIPLMSDTRWGSRGKTVGAFLDHFKSAHSALTYLESRTSSNSNKANNLRHSMESFDTIVTAVTTNKILGYIQLLTKELQSPNIDLMTAYKEAREVAQVISTLRNEEGFCDIYAVKRTGQHHRCGSIKKSELPIGSKTERTYLHSQSKNTTDSICSTLLLTM